MVDKKITIEEYGEVVLKKFSFKDRCDLKGKVVKIEIDSLTRKEKTSIRPYCSSPGQAGNRPAARTH